MGIEVVGCPTVREEDGLAMSSRNAYLSAEEREAAAVLPRALDTGRKLVRGGERDASIVAGAMKEVVREEPRRRGRGDALRLRPSMRAPRGPSSWLTRAIRISWTTSNFVRTVFQSKVSLDGVRACRRGGRCGGGPCRRSRLSVRGRACRRRRGWSCHRVLRSRLWPLWSRRSPSPA